MPNGNDSEYVGEKICRVGIYEGLKQVRESGSKRKKIIENELVWITFGIHFFIS